MEDTPVVQEYLDVFLEDLSRLPLEREVDLLLTWF